MAEITYSTASGSRSRASIFSGGPCPESIQFGRGHGVAPMTATAKLTGRFSVNYGQKLSMRIGSTVFVGLVTYIHNHNDTSEGRSTEIRLVDMRDRLHDHHVYGQFNMIDTSTGAYFHLLPKNWLAQVKTIVRKVDKQDFNKLEERPKIEFACDQGLISGATLFNELAKTFEFTWTASELAFKILRYSRPDNLDWNTGIKVIDALQEILDKNGLQMTFWGDLHCHVTLKGVSDNAFVRAMMNKPVCQIAGYTGDSRGGELNERGRRVAIVGERNRYENYYYATPNWNKKFTLEVVLGWELSVLLAEKNLTLLSKLKDLPEEWHDPERWNGEPRNEMSIGDYVQEICFKVYVVDSEYPIEDIYKTISTDPEKNKGFVTLAGMRDNVEFVGKKEQRKPTQYDGGEDAREWIHDNDPFEPEYNSYFPVADSLVSDSERQFVAFTSYKNIRVKGATDPFDFNPSMVVPVIDGVSLDVETVVDKKNCCERYRIRLIFSEMKYIMSVDETGKPENEKLKLYEKGELKNYGPDYIAVKLALDKELFTWQAGEPGTAPRVREQKHSVAGLRRNYIDDEEVSLLTAFMQGQEIDQFVNAEEIAVRVAQQVLFHEFITTSGNLEISQEAGFQCDGLIDTVNVSFDTTEGIKEQITFTSLVNEIAEPYIVSLSVDSKYKDVKKLVAEDLNKKRIEVVRQHRAAKAAAGNQDARKSKVAGDRSWHRRAITLGEDKTMAVTVTPKTLKEREELVVGEVMLIGNPDDSHLYNGPKEDDQIEIPDAYYINET